MWVVAEPKEFIRLLTYEIWKVQLDMNYSYFFYAFAQNRGQLIWDLFLFSLPIRSFDQRLVDKLTRYVIPVLNPDDSEYSFFFWFNQILQLRVWWTSWLGTWFLFWTRMVTNIHTRQTECGERRSAHKTTSAKALIPTEIGMRISARQVTRMYNHLVNKYLWGHLILSRSINFEKVSLKQKSEMKELLSHFQKRPIRG